MEARKKIALVVGAQGVIGQNLITYLSSLNDWSIIGLSRRGGIDTPSVQYISVDLLDEQKTTQKLRELRTVTHIFYAAYQAQPTWSALVPPNLAMLSNVVDAIEEATPGLQHVSLMQGYKVYGAHLGPFKSPARETDAGHMPPEFNVAQQDYLETKQRGKAWSWSAIRPSIVGGVALGNPMNLAIAIAVYASMSKELGLPLRFPGKPTAYHSLLEMTDATLLAKATVWAATTPSCANQAFNINNGDMFRWSEMWPKIADFFAINTAPGLPMSLTDVMADKEALWAAMTAKYGLEPHSYNEVSSWPFADAVFSWDYDMIADGSKARRFGFHDYIETEQMFLRIFEYLRARKIIP